MAGGNTFDRFEILPSRENGNSITIEISTTSGSPDGTPTNLRGSPGYVLMLTELFATNGVFLRKISDFKTANKSSIKYNTDKFPARFRCTLSNGESFDMELYKAANWTVRIYVNK